MPKRKAELETLYRSAIYKGPETCESQFAQLPKTGFVRLAQLIGNSKAGRPAIIPVSKSTIWSWVASQKFPKPVRIGARTTCWRVEDIRAFIERGR